MSNQDHAYALPSGFMLEEYQIERVLGSGSFGITYYARDTHLNKAVAIKEYMPSDWAARYDEATVAPKSSSDAGDYDWGLTRFLEEAQVLAGFDHPNINKVYRRLEAHGTAYMVLEYLPGESLSARLKRTGRLSPDEVWRLFNELLSGLSEVHRQDYVHRDIKPGNIMFREDGGAVLLDFGAARQAVGQRSKSITSILTPGYAPIEQYDQKAVYVGPWTDFYALGVVAYRCVTGVREGELLDAPARSLLVLHGEREKDMPLAVEAAKGGYDKRLLNAIDWCMQVDKRERPQGVADLEKALAGGASKVKKKPKPKPAPKHPTRRVAAIVLLLMLAPWFGFGVWQWLSSPAPSPLADDPGEASAPAVVPAPPPPPRVAAEPGSLMLELSPADARVILPDIESPYQPGMALAAGSYRVVVHQAGYEEFAGTLRIEAGRRTTRTITLAQEPGSLVLELEPRDAQVMLPDIESSYRPGLALPAGEYRVVVRREGYEAFDDTLRIEAGRRTVRAITLVEAAGSLVLELSPADAQVSLPDSRLSYQPGMALPAGEYRVLVRRAGYAEFSGALRIEAGRRTTRAIALRRAEPERAEFEVFRDTLKSGGKGPEMVVLPTGRFRMGDLNGNGEDNEKPVRTVTIGRPIAIGKYEVTVGQFRRFVTATAYQTEAERNTGGRQGCHTVELTNRNTWDWTPGRSWSNLEYRVEDNQPVTCVSWNDARRYIDWLNEETGGRYRLPSEAEWEYAARAGSSSRYYFGDDESQFCRYGNVADTTRLPNGGSWLMKADCSDGAVYPTAVGRYRANPFGLFDMHGNVLEWVQDCWHDNYEGAPIDGSAWTSVCDGGSRAVVRGGSWNYGPSWLRSAGRGRSEPSARDISLGFRLVQDINP